MNTSISAKRSGLKRDDGASRSLGRQRLPGHSALAGILAWS